MEEEIFIDTNDNFVINGVLNWKVKSKRLVIFVHGLTGYKSEHQFFNGSKFFTERGFATFRFDLYPGGENGRWLKNCTIKTHSNDLNCVLDFFKDEFEEIFLVGHSLGGPTILLSNYACVKKIILWDPSLNLNERLDEFLTFNKEFDQYFIGWGVDIVISKEMIEEWKFWESSNEEVFELIVKPIKIICAENVFLKDVWGKSLNKIKVENDFLVIKNSGHNFDEEGCEEILFEETLKWIEDN